MIQPGLEILLGFVMAVCAYFAITQEFAKIMVAITIILFLIATLIAFSNNDLGGIIGNYVFFAIGNALGAVGTVIFNVILKPILQRI